MRLKKWHSVALLLASPFLLLLVMLASVFAATQLMGHSSIGVETSAPVSDVIPLMCLAERLRAELGPDAVYVDEWKYLRAFGDAGFAIAHWELHLSVHDYVERDGGVTGRVSVSTYGLHANSTELTPDVIAFGVSRVHSTWRELETHCGLRRLGPISCTARGRDEIPCTIPQ